MGSPTAKDISSDEFNSILARYPASIASHSESLPAPRSAKSPPGTLLELDSWRLKSLPEILSSRKSPHLTKTELESILQCKMCVSFLDAIHADPLRSGNAVNVVRHSPLSSHPIPTI